MNLALAELRRDTGGVYGRALLPKNTPWRSEAYLKRVASLPCAHCGVVGFSQAAHADEGKGMGIKASDDTAFPACGPRLGQPGCHWLIGTSGRFSRDERRRLERKYAKQTRRALNAEVLGDAPTRAASNTNILEVSEVTTRGEPTTTARPMRVLHLTLKRQWFDMIASGHKREEYREMKPYWHTRLMGTEGKFDAVHFRNGYSRDARSMTVEFRELRSGLGIVEWGAPEGQAVYILCLGEILQAHNVQPCATRPLDGVVGRLVEKRGNGGDS